MEDWLADSILRLAEYRIKYKNNFLKAYKITYVIEFETWNIPSDSEVPAFYFCYLIESDSKRQWSLAEKLKRNVFMENKKWKTHELFIRPVELWAFDRVRDSAVAHALV